MAPDDSNDAGVDTMVLDPWGSETIDDYHSLVADFGMEPFQEILPEVPDPHYLMRRGVIFGHRDYGRVIEAMQSGAPFAALSGFMPTGEPHVGHKMVFDELVWHQQQGGEVYGLIADLEAHSAREMSWADIDEYARAYTLSFLASGFDPAAGELYRQSENRTVQDLAFEIGIEANFSEMQAIYGFDGETDISHLQSVITQAADILYPQLQHGPIPTVIPVGSDQDPHIRLTRDLAARTRFFGVTEAYASFELTEDERAILSGLYDNLSETADAPDDIRCIDAAVALESGEDAVDMTGRGAYDRTELPPNVDPTERSLHTKLDNAGMEPLRPRVRILNRKATEAAFEALIEAISGEKRVYDQHIDCFELDIDGAIEVTRSVELEHGGYGFLPPSSIYHRFISGLTGGKMSSSIPASHISLLDDPADGARKVEEATTGGRETAALQRELGGRADECPVYELYAYVLAGEDDDLAETVYNECVNGERLCGDCKGQAAELMRAFLEEHQEKREAWADRLDELDIDLEPDRSV